jgi:membrane-bound lytic murein transglycosylase D
MRALSVVVAVLLSLLAPVADAATTAFPRPPEIEHQIAFWRRVFAEYSKYQVVVHDTVDLDKVYSVLDFRDLVANGTSLIEVERLQKDETDLEMERIRGLLRRLQDGASNEQLTVEERRIRDLFKNDSSPTKFIDATDDKRLRSQRGIREKFEEGYRHARRYFPEMERIFSEAGLPPELTRLPLIESCFNLHAYSKVGAAGIWQFMPSTGRLYMDVGGLVDERKDPIASPRAAARFLGGNYDRLGSWPLAITAYNHGPGGMSRAVRETGTADIGTIIRDYRGPAFGFASRNFYPEFLAALDVDKHHETYFGKINPEPPLPSHVIALDQSIGLEVAARLARTDADTLASLNPALMDPVVQGRRAIPAGYSLRVPKPSGEGFEDRFAELVAEERVVRVSAPPPPTRRNNQRSAQTRNAAVTHRVKKGQTLSSIAQKYRVSEKSLRTANRLGKSKTIKTGQVLRIPGQS